MAKPTFWLSIPAIRCNRWRPNDNPGDPIRGGCLYRTLDRSPVDQGRCHSAKGLASP
jgi:hypothetical protein